MQKRIFDYSQLSRVQDFDCGQEEWEREVSDWIKSEGPEGALAESSRSSRPCKVWLYESDDGQIVGFGSLGETNWGRRVEGDPNSPFTVIPNFAVQSRFQGQPANVSPDERYASLIMDDLIFEASEIPNRRPLLGLFVDVRNVRAIRFYERFGFQRLTSRVDSDTGREYLRMVLRFR